MSRKSSTELVFTVKLAAPRNSTIPMVRHFIGKALESERTRRASTDPMSEFDFESVRIALFERHTTYGD